MTCTSPRLKAGFRILAALMLPSLSPVPTMVWISSIKRITFPAFLMSSNSPFTRLSNWPRNWVPATRAGHIQQIELLVLQPEGHIPPGNPLGNALSNSGFAYAGLTDQAGVILLRRDRI